jgi:hypothetical protein
LLPKLSALWKEETAFEKIVFTYVFFFSRKEKPFIAKSITIATNCQRGARAARDPINAWRPWGGAL